MTTPLGIRGHETDGDRSSRLPLRVLVAAVVCLAAVAGLLAVRPGRAATETRPPLSTREVVALASEPSGGVVEVEPQKQVASRLVPSDDPCEFYEGFRSVDDALLPTSPALELS